MEVFNLEEAELLAKMMQTDSNLARCYLDLKRSIADEQRKKPKWYTEELEEILGLLADTLQVPRYNADALLAAAKSRMGYAEKLTRAVLSFVLENHEQEDGSVMVHCGLCSIYDGHSESCPLSNQPPPEMPGKTFGGAFHWRDGLYFYRMPDGAVRIVLSDIIGGLEPNMLAPEGTQSNHLDVIVPRAEWDSIAKACGNSTVLSIQSTQGHEDAEPCKVRPTPADGATPSPCSRCGLWSGHAPGCPALPGVSHSEEK